MKRRSCKFRRPSGRRGNHWQKEVLTRIQEPFSIPRSKCRFMESRGPNSMLIPGGRLFSRNLRSWRTNAHSPEWRKTSDDYSADYHKLRMISTVHAATLACRRHAASRFIRNPSGEGRRRWTRRMRRFPLAFLLQSQLAVTLAFDQSSVSALCS